MNYHNFFAELKRRNVYKVAVAYAIVGWLLVQVATQVFPFFEIPNWAVRLIVLAIVIGFPIALVIAWAFELTPEGLKRTEDVDVAPQKRRKSHAWIYVVVLGAVLSIALFFLGRYSTGNNAASRSASEELRRDKQSEVATGIKRGSRTNARWSWIPNSRWRGRGWPRPTSGIAILPPRGARKASTII